MVEVVGTAPTSAMLITKFVYRHSWKTNTNNIKLKKNRFNKLFMKLTKEQQQEIKKFQFQQLRITRVFSLDFEKILFEAIPIFV